MVSKTTIIFVPGSWHPASCWDEVASQLFQAGYQTGQVSLPSVGPAEHLKNFDPDVEEIRSHILSAAELGQRIIVVAHSYGGIPTSQAVEGLDIKSREAQGKPGGVAHIVFCCSFLIPEGESHISSGGGVKVDWVLVSEDGLECIPAEPEEHFYNDLSPEDQKKAVALLKPHSFQTSHSRLTYAGWKHIPSTYIYSTKDNAIPLFVQKMMVEEGAKGYNIRTETLESGHSPFWSMPGELVGVIRRAVEGE